MSDETIKMHFVIDASNIKKRVKWKDIKLMRRFAGKALNDEALDQVQIVACRFMVDENNNYLPFEEAYALFDELSQEEAEDVLDKFNKAYAESTIPKVKEGQLNSISEASSLTPPNSPIG